MKTYIMNIEIWTIKEDEILRELVATHGLGCCKYIIHLKLCVIFISIACLNRFVGSVIADLFPGRTGKQCRERWHNHLNPGIKKGDW